MLRMLLFIALALPLAATAGTVYKYFDANGNVVFTDQPVPGAEKIVVPETQTYSPEPTARPRQILPAMPATPGGDASQLNPYSQFKIRSPAPDETFRNVDDVLVSLSILPRLRQGHKVQLLLDGKPVGAAKPSPQFALPGIARGSHSVVAQILDAQGRVVAKTGSVSFHVHKTSALTKPAPANPGGNRGGGTSATGPAINLPSLPSARRMPMAAQGPRAARAGG